MATILPEDEVDDDIIAAEAADLIASGYEATCPSCQEGVTLIEVPRSTDVIYCDMCEMWFKVGLPKHAYA